VEDTTPGSPAATCAQRKSSTTGGDRLDLFEEHPGFGDASFRYLGVTVCGEYGHTDRFTFVASLPIKAQRSERVAQIGGGAVRLPEARNTVGLGDLWLSLRTGLATEPVVSVQTGVKSHSATMTNRTTTDLVSVREISTARSACSWADHCTPCQLTSAEASATADAVDA
jgi:hypothetical protein